MTPRRILVTDCDFGEGKVEQAVLGEEFVVDFLGSRDPDHIVRAAEGYDGLFVQWAQLTSATLEQLRTVRGIVRYGIGLDNIDLGAASERGIVVRNVDDYCIDEVADQAVSCIIAANRRLIEADRRVKSGQWSSADGLSPLPPSDDPVGLIGMGRIGRAAATRLRSAGFPVHYFDPLVAQGDLSEHFGIEATQAPNVEELAERVNHLSLHVPLIESTKHIVNSGLLSRLGSAGHIVNTSRGGLVNEQNLIDALDAGTVRWASLDVLAQEPPSEGTSKTLAEHPRVLSTPHMAYLSTESLRRLPIHAARRMREALA